MQQQRTNTFLVLLAVPVLALLVMLQATVGARVALFGIKPNLVLLTVLLWTLLRGRREALIVAFTGGFWLDFLALTTLGISSLALVLSSFITGIGRRVVQPTQVLVPVGVGILGALIYAAVYWVGSRGRRIAADVDQSAGLLGHPAAVPGCGHAVADALAVRAPVPHTGPGSRRRCLVLRRLDTPTGPPGLFGSGSGWP